MDFSFPLEEIGKTRPFPLNDRIIPPKTKIEDPFAIDSMIEQINRIKNDIENSTKTNISLLDSCFRQIIKNLKNDKDNEIVKQLQNNENFRDNVIFLFINFSSKDFIPSLCELLDLLSSYDYETASAFFASNSWEYIKERYENTDEILASHLFINTDDLEEQEEIRKQAEGYFLDEEIGTHFIKYMFEDKERRAIRNSILGIIKNLTQFEIFEFVTTLDIFNTLICSLSKFTDNGIKYEIINTISVVLFRIIAVMKKESSHELLSLISPIQDMIIDIMDICDPNSIASCVNLFKVYILCENINEKSEQIIMRIIEFLKTECEQFNQFKAQEKDHEEEQEQESSEQYFISFSPKYNSFDYSSYFDSFEISRITIFDFFIHCFKIGKLTNFITDLIDWKILWQFIMEKSKENTNQEKDFFVSMICKFFEIDHSNINCFIQIIPEILNYYDNCINVVQENIFLGICCASDQFSIDIYNILLDNDFLGKTSSLALLSGNNALLYAKLFKIIFDYVHSSPTKEKEYSYSISDTTTLQEIIEESEDDETFIDASEICSLILSQYEDH